MAVILENERKSAKARIFLALVYAVLTVGAVSMVYPFAVMLSASCSSNYDYRRHDAVVRGLFDPADRFMRSIAGYFKSFPREIFSDAPEHWTLWSEVAKDRDGVREFYRRHIEGEIAPLTHRREECRQFLSMLKTLPDTALSCNYDPREVPAFMRARYGDINRLNAVWPVRYRSFYEVSFSAEAKASPNRVLPDNEKTAAWQALKRDCIERALVNGDCVCRTMPYPLHAYADSIRTALITQFREHGWRDFLKSCFDNYRLVGGYLFLRGRAFVNTLLLVALSVLSALTVNPLAAYALSRFRPRCTEKILLFLLATTAFPAAVTAIPGFLLIRDLGLLNTFAALVLPTVASGMSIFILKGFFDALPRELYEAAAIDGASEWTVFTRITLPMTTPILAVNALNSFIHAYSSWEWALLVCQKESHWTLAVWMYQMSQTLSHQPWCVTAGFVLVSIPTAAVFLLCQRVILRGIVLPSMK